MSPSPLAPLGAESAIGPPRLSLAPDAPQESEPAPGFDPMLARDPAAADEAGPRNHEDVGAAAGAGSGEHGEEHDDSLADETGKDDTISLPFQPKLNPRCRVASGIVAGMLTDIFGRKVGRAAHVAHLIGKQESFVSRCAKGERQMSVAQAFAGGIMEDIADLTKQHYRSARIVRSVNKPLEMFALDTTIANGRLVERIKAATAAFLERGISDAARAELIQAAERARAEDEAVLQAIRDLPAVDERRQA